MDVFYILVHYEIWNWKYHIDMLLSMYISFKGEKTFFFWQDNLSFPLLCPDWNVDEEMLLLEVICLHTKLTYH